LTEVQSARQSVTQLCGAISADVSDPAQAFTAVEQVVKEAGVPHLLVNSAGITRPGYFHELRLEVFRDMMETNYFGTLHMIKAVLPGMLERGSGHIVNISSVAGFLGVFGYSAYGASKFAVSGFSDILRAELRPRGICVSVVYPIDVDTPQLAEELPLRPAETQAICEGLPVLAPEYVAAAILHGVSRRRYAIVPSPMGKTLYWLFRTVNHVAIPVMDWIARRAHAQVQQNN
jgi:3-dehydrosphinganine reductase